MSGSEEVAATPTCVPGLGRVCRRAARLERTCLGPHLLPARGLEFRRYVLCVYVFVLLPFPQEGHTHTHLHTWFLLIHFPLHSLPGDTVIYSSYANTALTVPIFALSGSPSLSFPNKKTNTYISAYACHTSSSNKCLLPACRSPLLPSPISLSGKLTPLSSFPGLSRLPLLHETVPHFLPDRGLALPCSSVPPCSSARRQCVQAYLARSLPGTTLSNCVFSTLMDCPGHMWFKVLPPTRSC